MCSCQIVGTGTHSNKYQAYGLLPPSSPIMMDMAGFFKTLIPIYQTKGITPRRLNL
jgi:hypothetical protein